MRTFRDTPTRTPAAPPRRAAPPHPLLAVQRVAGNRATRRLLRDKLDMRVPKDLDPTTDARPLPQVTAPSGTATVTPDAKLPGGWDDAKMTSGTVGTMKRILLDGLPGSQREQPEEKVKPPEKSGQYAHAVGSGDKKHRGRAVAVVPPDLTKDSGPVAVIVHFHGIDLKSTVLGSTGMRSEDRPEDVADFQIPQQVEQFLKDRPGARIVVLMPIGITVPAGKGFTSSFGIGDLDAYVTACLTQLGLDPAPAGLYLSAHSGGGFTITGFDKLPSSVRGVLGFESFHAADLDSWKTLATSRLRSEVAELQKIRDEKIKDKDPDKDVDEDAVAAAQVAYLRDKGFRLELFGGGDYTGNVDAIRTAIIDWFDGKDGSGGRAALKKAMGGKIRTDVVKQLWLNFQALDYSGSTHMNALSLDSHFGQALANLPRVGALAPKPPPAAPKAPPATPKAPPVGAGAH